jgi:hypothetical protein
MACWREAYLAGLRRVGMSFVSVGQRLTNTGCLAVLAFLSACAAGQPPVVEKLDDLTAVTITHSRTPLFLSPEIETNGATAREFVQIGVLEINRMGALEYFLWLGIWDRDNFDSGETHPDAYASIVILTETGSLPFEIHGWSHQSIGTSERVYKKIFPEDLDAYYKISLEQIKMLAEATSVKVATTGPESKRFVPWYNQDRGQSDLRAFVSAVTY